jgi:hypothetical protein
MSKHDESSGGSTSAGVVTLNTRVRVHADTPAEVRGVVVEDFGDSAGQGVEIGEYRFAEPARRWAVALDAGDLVFVEFSELLTVCNGHYLHKCVTHDCVRRSMARVVRASRVEDHVGVPPGLRPRRGCDGSGAGRAECRCQGR